MTEELAELVRETLKVNQFCKLCGTRKSHHKIKGNFSVEWYEWTPSNEYILAEALKKAYK